MKKLDSIKFFIIGFASIILILVALVFVWHNDIRNSTKRLQSIADKQLETSLITNLRDATHRRAISLARMNAMDDPFSRDEEFMKIREMGTQFLISRDQLWARPMHEEEKKAWEVAKENMSKGGRIQHEVLTLIQEDSMEEAKDIFIKKLVPSQDKFVDSVSDILEMKRKEVESELAEAAKHNKDAYRFIALLGTVAFLLSIFMVFVIRRTRSTEQALVEQSDRLRLLYKVSSMSGINLYEQIDEMLKLGCNILKLDCGRVIKVDKESNTATLLNVAGPDTYGQKPGSMYYLNESLCNITYQRSAPFEFTGINNINLPEHDELLRSIKVGAYLGSVITLNGKPYGTVNFSARAKRQTPFSEGDKDIINLMSNWISVALERQIHQQELKEAKDSAEAANKTKSAFLANMSHELRTPLNAIIGYSEILTEDASDTGDTSALEDLDKIKGSGQHLLSLINDVLDLSKIEAGKMDFRFETINVKTVIDELVSNIQPTIDKNNNKIIKTFDDPDQEVYADNIRFKQVVLNLLSNANKFTHDGKITVDVKTVKRNQEDFISIAVRDTGIGMSSEQMDRVFEAFSQADSNISKKYGGTGLGLAITRRICTLMDGEISVESVEGIGSTFTVSFPSAKTGENRSRDVAVA
jgi:signal transduction histidine kinase/preprotein translocase subunit YajC